MAKGLSLEQFRDQLEADAQKRCVTQEKTIKELHETIEKLENRIPALENKCFIGNCGVICIFCTDKNICKARERLR